MQYDSFKLIYDGLSERKKILIFQLVQNLEHTKDNPNDNIDYSRGLKIALCEQNMSIGDLTNELEKRTGYHELRETVASMIERGSRNSEHFQNTLEILEIDEVFLIKNSEYFQSRIHDIEWCFTHLSHQNQEAVYFLTLQLSSDFSSELFSDLPCNLGIEDDINFN